MSALRIAASLFAAGCLAACVSLLPKPPPPSTIYSLRAGDVQKAAGEPKAVVVAIAEPTAPRSVAGADIVWRTGAEIAFMDKSAWDGTAPELLQDLLIDTMDRRGAVRAVVQSGAGMRADVDVRWDVLTFEIEEDGSGLQANFAVAAKLVDLRTRTVAESARFEAHAPISSRSGRVAAAAMERAARDVSLQIADWAAAKAEPPPPPVASAPQPRAASTRR